MEVLGNALLILPDENPEETKGGVIIPKTIENKPNSGTIVACGKRCEIAQKGKKVQYPRKSASVINVDGKDHHFIIEDQIFIVE